MSAGEFWGGAIFWYLVYFFGILSIPYLWRAFITIGDWFVPLFEKLFGILFSYLSSLPGPQTTYKDRKYAYEAALNNETSTQEALKSLYWKSSYAYLILDFGSRYILKIDLERWNQIPSILYRWAARTFDRLKWWWFLAANEHFPLKLIRFIYRLLSGYYLPHKIKQRREAAEAFERQREANERAHAERQREAFRKQQPDFKEQEELRQRQEREREQREQAAAKKAAQLRKKLATQTKELPSPSCYEDAIAIFGLEDDFSERTFRKIFRKRMMGVHPDRGGCAQSALAVNQARDIINDYKGW